VFINGSVRDQAETHASTVDEFLRERGIARAPEDALSPAPDTALTDGTTIAYRQAVPVTVDIDGIRRQFVTAAENVRAALTAQGIVPGPHDRVIPSLTSGLAANAEIQVTHATSWFERIRTAILPKVKRHYDVGMTAGTERVIDPGAAGTKETTVEVLQPAGSGARKRVILAARVLRFPRMRVIAEGVGDGSALTTMARRGLASTARLADAALRMVATAYTAACSGCSGIGQRAGHGIVAVDPHFIPLGTHVFIPGYGPALAGDTGGSIRGNRIDLGFDSMRDALSFGRRPVVVYVLNK
jgi:3D (Asp-Asp-Asp) domain-containing protein